MKKEDREGKGTGKEEGRDGYHTVIVLCGKSKQCIGTRRANRVLFFIGAVRAGLFSEVTAEQLLKGWSYMGH